MNQESPPLNQDKAKQYIEHDIIITLYNKNLHNPILLKNLESVYKSKFDFILNADNAKKMLSPNGQNYIVENMDDFSTFYLDTTKKLCESLGLNFILDPKKNHSFQPNDFVVSRDILNAEFIPSNVAGFTTLHNNHLLPNTYETGYLQTKLTQKLMALQSHSNSAKNQVVLISEDIPESTYFLVKYINMKIESTPQNSLTKESVLKNIKSVSKSFSDTSSNDLKLKS